MFACQELTLNQTLEVNTSVSSMERELQLMEDDGLWTHMATKEIMTPKFLTSSLYSTDNESKYEMICK